MMTLKTVGNWFVIAAIVIAVIEIVSRVTSTHNDPSAFFESSVMAGLGVIINELSERK